MADSRRDAGVLLHVTSLPERTFAGARAFIDWLGAAGFTVWQVLPLTPPKPEIGSPYDAVSAFAIDPALIDAAARDAAGLTTVARLEPQAREHFERWCAAEHGWLEPFVAFQVLRAAHGPSWHAWPAALRDRDEREVRKVLAARAAEADAIRLEQYVADMQWQDIRSHAASRGVRIFGDLPIFVALDSADVWAHRSEFLLDEEGQPTVVAGVPPDYFAADGQRWGNPHYDWARMAASGFDWWRARIARQRALFDLVRIDHFRGLEAAWHVPASSPTAREGSWVAGPGLALLDALIETAGPGSLIAEDLGIITPEVEAIRDAAGLPGMRVLQFGFDGDSGNPHAPGAIVSNCVVYTGTHDNDTTLGWWRGQETRTRWRVRLAARRPLLTGEAAVDALVRIAFGSSAALAIVPAQDLLRLGSEARMNTPGTAMGNWAWRAEPGAFDAALATRARATLAGARRRATP